MIGTVNLPVLLKVLPLTLLLGIQALPLPVCNHNQTFIATRTQQCGLAATYNIQYFN